LEASATKSTITGDTICASDERQQSKEIDFELEFEFVVPYFGKFEEQRPSAE
jgi:hypothetical protein